METKEPEEEEPDLPLFCVSPHVPFVLFLPSLPNPISFPLPQGSQSASLIIHVRSFAQLSFFTLRFLPSPISLEIYILRSSSLSSSFDPLLLSRLPPIPLFTHAYRNMGGWLFVTSLLPPLSHRFPYA